MSAAPAAGDGLGRTALILAASRGLADPVARRLGVSHKALVPVGGVPMLGRVVAALRQSGLVERIVVSAEEPAVLAGLGGAAAGLAFVASGGSPSDSVAKAVAELHEPFPLLVTTADHPLLSPAMIEHFCREALAGDADITAALAPAALIQRDYPGAVRTYFRFRDGRYSGCNLFMLARPEGMRAVEFWRRIERNRKRPWRILLAVGPVSLLLGASGMLTLEGAMARLSRRLGIRTACVVMPFAEAAIDVDKPEDLELVERILGRRNGEDGAERSGLSRG